MTLKKYIIDSKMFEYDRHYQECRQSNHPFIKARINPRNGNYFVQIDLMPCDYEFTIDGENHLKKLFEDEVTFLESRPDSKSLFNGSNVNKELSWFDGVLPDRLVLFCEKLYELSQNYHS
jgi:hypothetical protein